MADSQGLLDPRFDNTGNVNNGGGKVGSKRTVTLVKELYEGALLDVSRTRIKGIMEQIAKDADDPELPPHVRQKAQQMIMQAAQKAGDQAIEAEKIDQGMDGLEIDIRRDGLIIKSGRNMVRIDGGGTSRQAGVDGEMVPYSSYPTDSSLLTPDLDTYTGLKGESFMVCSPGSNIPLTEFVGPPRDPKILQQLFLPRKHNDPVLNWSVKYKEYLCIERPVSMNFNTEVIDERP